MITRILILMTLISLVPIPICAEFYKYRDANGVLRFTDNLMDVPEDQRENLQSYRETVTPEAEPQISESAQKAAALKNRNSRIEQINEEREALAQTFNDLEAERNAILESAPDPQDQEAYEAHRQRITTFNEKIKAYEQKRKLFQETVDAFNAEVKAE